MSRTKQRARKQTGKRKREEEADGAPTAKKPETSRPEQTTYDESISMMDPVLMSDHLAKSLTKISGNSTVLELEDRHIPTRAIKDTTTFTKPRIASQLPAYLETFTASGKEALASGDIGAPHTLVITASGIRAADLARALRTLGQDDVKIAKLFAKHMKLAETVAFVQRTKISIGVGTPSRPKELIEQGALKVTNLRRIVLDGSYIDEKKRTIFDLSEVFLPLIQLLNLEQIKVKLGAEKDGIEILVF